MKHTQHTIFSKTNQALSTHLWAPDQKALCVLIIVHGMAEHILRYEDFARALTERQVAVVGMDLPGHGHSAQEGFGYFAKKDGMLYVEECILQLKDFAKQHYPFAPLFLLGHSMGSFFARDIAAKFPDDIDGFIFSGTAGSNKILGLAKALARGQMLLQGAKKDGTTLHKMAFGPYNKPFYPNRTDYDWLSSDESVVDRYIADEKCGFVFTASGFYDLFSVLQAISRPHWATSLDRTKPYLLLSGMMDPVGDLGKGVKEVHDRMVKAKIANLSLLLYAQGRHEMLNEVNKTEVYEDICRFIEKNILDVKK